MPGCDNAPETATVGMPGYNNVPETAHVAKNGDSGASISILGTLLLCNPTNGRRATCIHVKEAAR